MPVDTNEVVGFLNHCPDADWLTDVWHGVALRIKEISGKCPLATYIHSQTALVAEPPPKPMAAPSVRALLVPESEPDTGEFQPIADAGVVSDPPFGAGVIDPDPPTDETDPPGG